MLSTISPAAQQFVNSINNVQTQMAVAEQQISTGLKVSQPSDAPDQISPILQLHSAIQQNQDIQNGLNSATTTLQASDTALSGAINLLQSASVIASQATGTSQTADMRTILAQNVQTIMEQMVAASSTTVGGNYIFSGDQPGTPLYQLDLAAPTGVDRLQVSNATSLVQGTGGAQYSTSLSSNVIFDPRNADNTPSSNNTFAALNGLRVALLANDTAGITNSVAALNSASTYMNSQLAFYGQAEDRVSSDLNQAQSASVQLQTQLSSMTDADMTQAMTALTQGTTQLQAALSARARIPNTSLFDVLPLTT
jgi:flagellar hook-associated protein 3 FlgL